ncbi:MAG TPA: hypothetical protein VFC78_24120 [Tepidisphaeraceae bacterium]|nr:hypothetical protein [Tepidisphaeraceae bacterium]
MKSLKKVRSMLAHALFDSSHETQGARTGSRCGRPAIERLESRVYQSADPVTYHGGHLLSNVSVQALYYGNGWATPHEEGVAAYLNGFLGSVTNSPYMDQLQEYSEPGMVIRRGTFIGGQLDLSAPVTQPATPSNPIATVDRTTIESELNKQIITPHLLLAAANPNRLYIVYVEPGVKVTYTDSNGILQSSASGGFAGFHWHFVDSQGDTVYYAVVPRTVDPTQDSMTITSSHELAEAITDPDNANGWFDGELAEIGDKAEGGYGNIDGYAVQDEWSNRRNEPFVLTVPNSRSFSIDGGGNIKLFDTDNMLWTRNRDGYWLGASQGEDDHITID